MTSDQSKSPRFQRWWQEKFAHVPRFRLWLAAGWVVWLSTIAVWTLPFLHWHHYPLAAGVIHSLTYTPLIACIIFGGLAWVRGKPTEVAPSKNIAHIARLDHLRFFAAALVVLYHYYHGLVPLDAVSDHVLLNVISEGSSGVGLFFVVSGFIFGMIADGNKIRYWDFIFSRVVRIYPLYLFAIVIVTGVYREQFSAVDNAVLLLPVFATTMLPGLPGFGQLWTIGLEFQFYLIFPFLAVFVRRNGYRYLVGLLALAVVLRTLYFSQLGAVREIGHWTLLGRIDQFIAGLLSAFIFLRRRAWFSHPLHVAGAIGIMLLCFRWLAIWGGYQRGGGSPLWVIWPTIEGVFWSYLLLSYLSCRWTLPRGLDESLQSLGQLSFSIYVMHSFAMYWVQKQGAAIALVSDRDWDAALRGVFICLPLVVILAAVTYHLIEKQFLIYRRRYVEPIEGAGSRF